MMRLSPNQLNAAMRRASRLTIKEATCEMTPAEYVELFKMHYASALLRVLERDNLGSPTDDFMSRVEAAVEITIA